MKTKKFGFYLNGEKLVKTVICANKKAAKDKLNFHFPENFNIEIKFIKTIRL